MICGLSVRSRLTMWFGTALAVILLGFGVLTYFLMWHQQLEQVDAGLHEELSDVFGEVKKGNNRQEMLGWLERRFAHHEGFDFQVTTTSGERIFANQRLGERRLPLTNPPAGSDGPWYETVSIPQVGHYRIVTRQVAGPSEGLTVQVARPLDSVEAEMLELLGALLIAGALALVLTVAGGYFLARRALAPVDQMTVTANEIDVQKLDRRLEVANPGDELGRLGQTLNHMLDRLERAFDEMRRFTADASHELRTPLAVIRSEAEVALCKPLSESEKQELLGSILEECEHLSWVTEQLLTLCREDAGISPLSREPVDLSQLVRGVTDTMRLLAEAKGQQLTASLNGSVIVQGDPVRLRHVIYNLIDNAIKYTPANGRVTVSVSELDHVARLLVDDTGIGIPEQDLPRVFDRFYRVDKSRNRAQGGSGLGLSIVQSIVSAHGGTVAITRRSESGTRCIVELPQSPVREVRS